MTFLATLCPSLFVIIIKYCLLSTQILHGSDHRKITIAMVDSSHLKGRDTLHGLLKPQQVSIQLVGIAKEDFEKIMNDYRQKFPSNPASVSSEASFEATLVNITEVFEDVPSLKNPSTDEAEMTELHGSAQSAPIVELVNRLLGKALDQKATEIHLEPQETSLLIRYRQGSSLRPLVDPLPRKVTPFLIARLKLMAELDINRRQLPQKGRIRRIYAGKTVYLIVSTLPSFYGEKVVIRILDHAQPLIRLEGLLTHAATLKQVKELVQRPSGLFLVAGSDRYQTTHLLYALLLSQTQQRASLATVEDPMMRILEGVTQVEVDEDKGMDYETALQAFLSQAANVILIDQLTGDKIAKQAIDLALQGRLVIASLPAHNPASAIAHLRRWVDANPLADALVGVMSQQPIRRVCPACRLEDSPSLEVLSSLRISPTQIQGGNFYRANTLSEGAIAQLKLKGRVCRQCNGSGYLGQLDTFEVIEVTPTLKNAIATGADVGTLLQLAQQEGMTSRLAYGVDLAIRGETTLEELKRNFADELKPVYPAGSLVVSSHIQEKLQTLETYLGALTAEFHQLQAAIRGNTTNPPLSESQETNRLRTIPPVTPISKPSTPEVPIYETFIAESNWGDLQQAVDSSKATMVSDDATIYEEELVDPGDWDALKQELDPNKETITADSPFPKKKDNQTNTEDINPFKSIIDPWS